VDRKQGREFNLTTCLAPTSGLASTLRVEARRESGRAQQASVSRLAPVKHSAVPRPRVVGTSVSAISRGASPPRLPPKPPQGRKPSGKR
jgi:hypothetical protein